MKVKIASGAYFMLIFVIRHDFYLYMDEFQNFATQAGQRVVMQFELPRNGCCDKINFSNCTTTGQRCRLHSLSFCDRGDSTGDFMLYLSNYAHSLRCIGQALQNQNIEVFELSADTNEFRVRCGDPNPPYTALIQLQFSLDRIKLLDRDGQARRGQSNSELRFDTISEILRAAGKYIDNNRGHLRWLNNSCFYDQGAIEIGYQTSAGDVRSETLAMNFLRQAAVHMYKRRTGVSNPINILTR
jgi:hypothetical protein